MTGMELTMSCSQAVSKDTKRTDWLSASGFPGLCMNAAWYNAEYNIIGQRAMTPGSKRKREGINPSD